MAQLVGAALVRLVGDQEASAHQGVERGARARVAGRELRLAAPRAGALRRDQADEHALGRGGLRRGQRLDDRVGVARERAGHPAHRLQLRGGDEVPVDVARLPQLGQRELQERQAALDLRAGDDQLVDHRLGLEADPGRLGRPGDHLADAVGPERAQEEEGALEVVAEGGQRGQAAEVVGPGPGQELHPGHPGGEAGQRALGRGRLVRLAQGDQLFELVGEHDQAAAVAQLLAQRVAQGRAIGQELERRALVDVERAAQGDGQRAQRPAAGQEVRGRPDPLPAEGAVGDRRQDARAAERRLARPGAAGHDDEGLRAQAVDDRADLLAAPEEEGAVVGLERAQAAVGVAARQRPDRARPLQVLERVAQLVGRGEPALGIALQATIDDRREPDVDPGRPGQGGGVAVLDQTRQVHGRDVVVRGVAGGQLVEHGAE